MHGDGGQHHAKQSAQEDGGSEPFTQHRGEGFGNLQRGQSGTHESPRRVQGIGGCNHHQPGCKYIWKQHSGKKVEAGQLAMFPPPSSSEQGIWIKKNHVDHYRRTKTGNDGGKSIHSAGRLRGDTEAEEAAEGCAPINSGVPHGPGKAKHN